MIGVSNRYKEINNSSTRDTIVKTYFNDGKLPLRNECILSATVTEISNSTDNLTIGNVCTNKLEISIARFTDFNICNLFQLTFTEDGYVYDNGKLVYNKTDGYIVNKDGWIMPNVEGTGKYKIVSKIDVSTGEFRTTDNIAVIVESVGELEDKRVCYQSYNSRDEALENERYFYIAVNKPVKANFIVPKGTSYIVVGVSASKQTRITISKDTTKTQWETAPEDERITLTENTKLNVESGLKVGNGYEFVTCGSYYIDTVEKNNNSNVIKVTAYDSSYRLNETYVPNISFPCDISLLVNDIVRQGKLRLKKETLPQIEISGVIENATCKTMLGYAVALMGKNARINRDDELEFYWYKNSGIVIDRSVQFMNSFVRKNEDITINSIRCTVGDDAMGAGSGPGMVIENPYMTLELLDGIYEKIKDFTYTPCTVKWRGNPSLEIIDLVNVEDLQGNMKTVVMTEVVTSLVGLNSNITCKGATETDLVMKQNSPIQQTINKVYNTLTEAFKNTTETILGHNGGYYTVDVDSEGKPCGWTIMDTPTLTSATKLWRMSMGGFGFSEDGGKTFANYAFDMLGRVNANAITVGTLRGIDIEVDSEIKVGKAIHLRSEEPFRHIYFSDRSKISLFNIEKDDFVMDRLSIENNQGGIVSRVSGIDIDQSKTKSTGELSGSIYMDAVSQIYFYSPQIIASSSIQVLSDERYKKNIKDIDLSNLINQIKIKSFDYIL